MTEWTGKKPGKNHYLLQQLSFMRTGVSGPLGAPLRPPWHNQAAANGDTASPLRTVHPGAWPAPRAPRRARAWGVPTLRSVARVGAGSGWHRQGRRLSLRSSRAWGQGYGIFRNMLSHLRSSRAWGQAHRGLLTDIRQSSGPRGRGCRASARYY